MIEVDIRPFGWSEGTFRDRYSFLLEPTYYTEDGRTYVESIFDLTSEKKLSVPPYLASKDLLGYLMSVIPGAKIKEVKLN